MDRETTVAFYYQIAETLKGRIESRQYQPDAILPSETTLAREFNVSNITIRKAMALLVRDGYVLRRRGIGTRVVFKGEQRIPLKITGNFRDWLDSALKEKHNLTVDVLETSRTACPFDVARILQIVPGSPIWQLKRVRKMKGEPISYYINYAPQPEIEETSPEEFKKDSFIEVFQKRCRLKISQIEQRVEATTADMDASAVLGVAFGAPLFFIENIYYTANLTPVEVSHMYFRGDRYIYKSGIMRY